MLGVSKRQLAGKPLGIFIADANDRKTFINHYKKVLRSGIKNICELGMRKMKGPLFDARLESIPSEDSNGEMTLIRTVVIDITERKKAESALRESEEKFRGIIKNLQDGYIRANKEGIVVMVGPSVAHMYGVKSRQQMIGITALSLYKNLKDRTLLLETRRKRNKVVDYEIEAIRKNGTSFPVSLNAQFYHDDHGQIQGTEALVRDITMRKRAEEYLAQLASFPQLNPNPVMEVSYAGEVVFFNPASQKVLEDYGMDKRDFSGFLPRDFHGICEDFEIRQKSTAYREVTIKDRVFGEHIYLSLLNGSAALPRT